MRFVTAQSVFDKVAGSRGGLPAWTYNNAELTRLEMEQVFLRQWAWVGHVSDIPRPGDFRCIDLAGERGFVIRDALNQVRAFHNLCRHRGSRVLAGKEGHCGSSIICPFHGWSYELDGRLKNIPRENTFPNIDRTLSGLKPLDCEIWHGLIFVRFEGSGVSVADTLREAEAEVALYNIDAMEPLDSEWTMDFDLDWKSVLDIDNEGYHVPKGHPELFDLTGASYQDQVTEGGLLRSHGYFKEKTPKTPVIRDYISALPEQSYLPASHQRQWIYWGMFPGVVITLFPDMIEVYQIYATGYQQSVMTGACYALADDREEMKKAREYNRLINTRVGQEDMQLVRWSAEAMRSRAFDGIHLSDLELGIAAFQNQLRQRIPVVSLTTAPETGELEKVNRELRTQGTRSAVA